MMAGIGASASRNEERLWPGPPNFAVEQTVGSHALAAAAHRGVRLPLKSGTRVSMVPVQGVVEPQRLGYAEETRDAMCDRTAGSHSLAAAGKRGRSASRDSHGPLGILDLLAERVGPQGQVVGVEFEPRFVEMAKRLAAVRNLNNVTVLGGDATGTGLPGTSFHLAHARLLLIVVPSPERVVAEMARRARPGGAVALFAAFEAIYRQDGKDLKVGRRIRGLLRAAGLKDVGVNAHCRVNGPGDLHQEQLLLFIKLLRGQIIARELLQEGELNTLIDELAAHLHDPGTLVVTQERLLSLRSYSRRGATSPTHMRLGHARRRTSACRGRPRTGAPEARR
jgi:SAM-dependent methyltransferase